MDHTEEWRDVAGFPGYIVSDQGRVARLMQPTENNGYLRVQLGLQRVRRVNRYVHQLVARTFLGWLDKEHPRSFRVVDHVNGDRQDNRVANLEWVSSAQNVHRAFSRCGRSKAP